MDSSEYRDQLLKLLPPGRAWSRALASTFARLLHAGGDELARVEARGLELIEEFDPRTTAELLTQWENLTGLPDPAVGEGGTIQARRDLVVAVLTEPGGQHVEDYIRAALAVGFVVTVTEFIPARVGAARVGDPIYGQAWSFALEINAPLETIQYAVVGGAAAGDPLAWWGNEILEAAIARMQQAHVTVFFTYS